jgi:predicted transcriptional regulator of viral defense system
MTRTVKDAARKLYEVAEGQQGLFTTKQAKQAGYLDEAHVYHVRMGNWIRERRGIYRLAQFPPTERPDLVLWHLWSCNRQEVPQGVFSHETALSIYELSDANPALLHMTVPRGFRRSAPIPDVLMLHFNDLSVSDVETMQGFRVTRPLRTVVDLLGDGQLSVGLISQAFEEAMKKGLFTVRDIERRVGKLNGRDPFEVLRQKVAP